MNDRRPVRSAPPAFRPARFTLAAPLLLGLAASCSTADGTPKPSTEPAQTEGLPSATPKAESPASGFVATLRERFRIAPTGRQLPRAHVAARTPITVIGEPLTRRLDVGLRIDPVFEPSVRGTVTAPAIVSYPLVSTGAVELADQQSGLGARVTLLGARATTADTAEGYLVYRDAFHGGDIVHRPRPDGFEDFITLLAETDTGEVRYSVALTTGVAGLRLVANTLELVDAKGTPRLHVAPPFLVDAKGARIWAQLAVNGCAVDTNPAPPWNHAPVSAGARTCTVSVSWDRGAIVYPALLDPAWTTAGAMANGRVFHSTARYADGTVLAIGGNDPNNPIVSVEVYNPNTDTWAATGSLKEAVNSATAHLVQGPSGAQVLLVGGFDGTNVLARAEVWDSVSGVWAFTGPMAAARASHGASLLNNGTVVALGGFGAAFTPIASAERYNPIAGTWPAAGSTAVARYVGTQNLIGTGALRAPGGIT